jgi:hypothetical protein
VGFRGPQDTSLRQECSQRASTGRKVRENRSHKAPCSTTREASDSRHSTMEWRFTFWVKKDRPSFWVKGDRPVPHMRKWGNTWTSRKHSRSPFQNSPSRFADYFSLSATLEMEESSLIHEPGKNSTAGLPIPRESIFHQGMEKERQTRKQKIRISKKYPPGNFCNRRLLTK